MRARWMAGPLLVVSCFAHAEIYMCEINGKKTFSQQPCGDNAKAVDVQGSANRITLPEEFDEAAAADICRMMVRSWEVAAQMKRQGIAIDRADRRTFGYLREHIANFDEAVRRSPELFTTLQRVSSRLTADAYRNPDILPGEREVATRQCTLQVSEEWRRSKVKSATKRSTTM